MRNTAMFLAMLLLTCSATAQKNSLPVKEWTAPPEEQPFVLYVSGDGGFNAFSSNICRLINKEGYSITAVNAKSYFWNKKTPQQAAQDVAAYAAQQLSGRKNQQWILIGYSFGADVLPFIVNMLPPTVAKTLASVILLSPSTSTDFEIHLLDMFGTGARRSMDVVAEINRMNTSKITTIFGSDDAAFPAASILLKNYRAEILSGGHRFEGNADKVVQTMIKYFR